MKTTAKQLIEAAKDYINWSLPFGHPDKGFCKWRLSDDETARRHRDEACEAMASHVLATVRPDDDEPVTRERLEADGWYWDRVSQEWRLQSGDDPNGDHCIMPQGKFFYWSGGMIGRYLKSMGHLRRLVAALGE